MTPRISVTLAGLLAAALGLFATAPQTQTKSNPIEAARMNNLGVAYMNQQLFEKGLKAFQQAAELDPKLTIARLNEGVAFLNLQKIDEAKGALEDAVKLDPKNPNARYNLGLLAKNTGDAQAAIDAFKHVIEIDANDADTWYFLGASYVQAKQFAQAIEAFQHALQLNPLHASAEFGLSRAYQQSAKIDQAREHLKKFQYITQQKIGAPISLAYGEQGQYSRAVESPSAVLKAPPQIKVRFVDVTAEVGLLSKPNEGEAGDAASFLGPGACFLDYDNDGKIDVLLADAGTLGGVALYHNLGGRFEDVTKKAGLDPSAHAIGCAVGDYDNDGFPDLATVFESNIVLLHNERNGTFRDVTETAAIHARPAEPVINIGSTFIDYDHDGDLDLYVTQYSKDPWVDPRPGHSENPKTPVPEHRFNEMWRNNGNGTFTDVSSETGLAGGVPSIAAMGTDYNNDRAVDLVVTGWHKATPIFENPREGKFEEK